MCKLMPKPCLEPCENILATFTQTSPVFTNQQQENIH